MPVGPDSAPARAAAVTADLAGVKRWKEKKINKFQENVCTANDVYNSTDNMPYNAQRIPATPPGGNVHQCGPGAGRPRPEHMEHMGRGGHSRKHFNLWQNDPNNFPTLISVAIINIRMGVYIWYAYIYI